MKMVRTRILALCVVMAAILVLAGCGAQSASTGSGGEQKSSALEPVVTEGLKQPGTLVIGIRGSAIAPFVVTSLNSLDTATGLDIELGAALADELGLEASFVNVDEVHQALSDTCDVVMDVSTDEANGFDVVGDYAETALSLFYKGEAATVSVDDIKGTRVALQEGSSAQMALRVTALEAKEVSCSTLNQAFDALDEGDADYVLCHASSGAYLTLWREGVSFAGAFSEPTVQGIAIPSGDGMVSSSVRSAYQELQNNGVLAEIRRSWLGDLPQLTSASVIANIPTRETSGESLTDISGSAEVLHSAQDGSTAGANAVSLAEVSSLATSSPTGAGTGTQDYTPTGYGSQSYGYDYSVDYSSTYYDTDSTGTQTDSGYDYSAPSGSSDYSDYSNYNETTDYGSGGDYTESYGY